MSIRDIITVPDEILKKISEPIEKVGVNEKKLINDLYETMYNSNGIGLAAVQVGILKRVLVVDVSSKEEEKKPICFINPSIKKISDEMSVYEEGCLSIPEVALEVTRPEVILFKYQDIHEKWYEEEFDGLLARAIQHEIDHLNGVLIIDLVSEMQRLKVNKEVKRIKNDSIIKLKRQPISKGFVL